MAASVDMGLRIRTNVQSLNAQRHLGQTRRTLSRHSEKLASGLRINRASDDVAGMAIAENLRADIRSLTQARRNANDAVAMLQVAESSLEEVTSIMIRLKELSVQAASDTIGRQERLFINEEFMALKDEIDRIVLATDYNGTRMLVGKGENVTEDLLADHNFPPLEMQVGKDYLEPADHLEARNPVNIVKIDFGLIDARTEGELGLNIGAVDNEEGTRVDSKESAQDSLARLDKALVRVASYRSTIGSYQNRLASAERNLGVQIESLSSARSRIIDADFALQTAGFTQTNILLQAGTAVLTQANQFPTAALKLVQAL